MSSPKLRSYAFITVSASVHSTALVLAHTVAKTPNFATSNLMHGAYFRFRIRYYYFRPRGSTRGSIIYIADSVIDSLTLHAHTLTLTRPRGRDRGRALSAQHVTAVKSSSSESKETVISGPRIQRRGSGG